MAKTQETSEERLRLLLETTRAIPWEARADNWAFTYVGPQAVKLLGYPLPEWFQKGFWADHIHPDDREEAIHFCMNASRTTEHYEFEYRMLAADGRAVWLHDLVRVVTVNGRPQKLRGFMIDITERKQAQEALRQSEAALQRSQKKLRDLAGRLLHAQEEERRRLARELHDDLTQRLAGLSIDAGKLAQETAIHEAHLDGKLQQIQQGLIQLSQDVHHMSRELHPAVLEDLGLVDAAATECTGFSRREGIPVQFQADGIPGNLPKPVALCLYRVIQEGLMNIAKHSQATEARVYIAGDNGSLHLSIRDGGQGFDMSRSREKGGLGLASMEERVRLLQGDFTVSSHPGGGTSIEVEMPVAGTER